MNYVLTEHRNGLAVINSDPALRSLWEEILNSISSISDEQIESEFVNNPREAKSISQALNILIDENLINYGWTRQSKIFKDPDYQDGKTWTLDFSKAAKLGNGKTTGIAVEVAFNHGEAIAWNLIKPTIAAEQNHVSKEVNVGEGVGVYICATAALKEAGGFDNAVGEYERVLKYLLPLNNLVRTPLIIIGLEKPEKFLVEHFSRIENPKKKIGRIVKL